VGKLDCLPHLLDSTKHKAANPTTNRTNIEIM